MNFLYQEKRTNSFSLVNKVVENECQCFNPFGTLLRITL